MVQKIVAVTGANGHLGRSLTKHLVSEGYHVHAIIRPQRERERCDFFKQLGVKVFLSTLDDQRALKEAFTGCEGVFHAAAPTFLWHRNAEEGIIKPIVEGTLSVVRAAAGVGVRRIIYTSTCAAIGFGNRSGTAVLDERQWNEGTSHPQFVAKMRAEREGSALAESNGVEFVGVCPPSILGPDFSRLTPSVEPYALMLQGKFPWLPDLGYHVIDVRDLARAQCSIFEKRDLKYRRYIVAGEFVHPQLILDVLTEFGLPTRLRPRWRIGARGLWWLATCDLLWHGLSRQPRKLTHAMVKECGGRFQRLDVSRFRNEFRLSLHSYRDTLCDTLNHLQSRETV